MNSLDDPAVNNKYLKCKIRMKRWESDFMEKYGRKPTKVCFLIFYKLLLSTINV